MAKKKPAKLIVQRPGAQGKRAIGYPIPSGQGGQYASWGKAVANWDFNRLGAVYKLREITKISPIAQAYVRQTKNTVVGKTGPTPTFGSVTNARERERLVQLWNEWSCDPTINGAGQDWGSLLRGLVASYAVDGRSFIIMRRNRDYKYGFGLMSIERDWLADDGYDDEVSYRIGGIDYKAINGVARAESGRTLAYIFYKDLSPQTVIRQRITGFPQAGQQSPSGTVEYSAVPVSMVCDFYVASSANDYEGGVSPLVPMMASLQKIHQLDEAVLLSMQLAAKTMGFIKRDENSHRYEQEVQDDEYMAPTDFEAGQIETLPPGYDFTAFDPDSPNTDMMEYRDRLTRNAIASSGLDYATLTGDLKDVNYSSIRHGMVQARDNSQITQKELEARVCKPVLEALLDTLELRGSRITRKAIEEARYTEWRHRSWDWVDPLKDVQAAVQAVTLGIASPQQIAQEQGRDFDKLVQELQEAKEQFDAIGMSFPPGEQPTIEANDDDDA